MITDIKFTVTNTVPGVTPSIIEISLDGAGLSYVRGCFPNGFTFDTAIELAHRLADSAYLDLSDAQDIVEALAEVGVIPQDGTLHTPAEAIRHFKGYIPL